MHLYYAEAKNTIPYDNVAMEEYLTFHTEPEDAVLYLWQNANTVVIGKNQNAFRECKVSKLTEAGGYLARRLSGGGAVYHDLGNLNFTFCVRKDKYDVDKQLSVIQRALARFGLDVEKSGRNDLTIDGKKFSGNAFYASGDYAYHHGTIMVDVNENSLMDYLTVSAAKLKAKGVDSVRSRVVNLKQLKPDITIAAIKAAMREAFSEVYGAEVYDYRFDEEAKKQIAERRAFFASNEWLYGKQKEFAVTFETKFSWGEVSVNLETEKDEIVGVKVYTDALDDILAQRLEEALLGASYRKESLETIGNADNSELREVVFWISTLI